MPSSKRTLKFGDVSFQEKIILSPEEKKEIARMVAEEVMRRISTILNQPKPTEKLLTVDELSRHIGYSKKTIYGWVHEGFIPYIKTRSGAVRFKLNKVLGWLERRENRGRARRKVKI